MRQTAQRPPCSRSARSQSSESRVRVAACARGQIVRTAPACVAPHPPRPAARTDPAPMYSTPSSRPPRPAPRLLRPSDNVLVSYATYDHGNTKESEEVFAPYRKLMEKQQARHTAQRAQHSKHGAHGSARAVRFDPCAHSAGPAAAGAGGPRLTLVAPVSRGCAQVKDACAAPHTCPRTPHSAACRSRASAWRGTCRATSA